PRRGGAEAPFVDEDEVGQGAALLTAGQRNRPPELTLDRDRRGLTGGGQSRHHEDGRTSSAQHEACYCGTALLGTPPMHPPATNVTWPARAGRAAPRAGRSADRSRLRAAAC